MSKLFSIFHILLSVCRTASMLILLFIKNFATKTLPFLVTVGMRTMVWFSVWFKESLFHLLVISSILEGEGVCRMERVKR